jgi:hypothetical protein
MRQIYTPVFLMLTLIFIGCAVPLTPPVPTPPPTPAPVAAPNVDNGAPILSGTLKRNCGESPNGNFQKAGRQVGEKAIDFTLKDVQGTEFTLSQLLTEKPVVMVFGSIT